jgi:hypothetical protein
VAEELRQTFNPDTIKKAPSTRNRLLQLRPTIDGEIIALMQDKQQEKILRSKL